MAPGCFLDTNVLLYAVSVDPGEAAKRDLARELLQEDDWTLSIQVLQEFDVQATWASRPWALPAADARALIDCWSRFTLQVITWDVLLSYWEAAIVAAAEASGCTLLLSEDLSDGERYRAIDVRNPFRTLAR